MSERIVVLGAGYSGILTAKKLARRLKKRTDANITVIDKNPFHTMLTELHEVAAWRVCEDSIRIDLDKVFYGRGVDVVLDTAVSVDYDKKVITGEASEYGYDYLVLATGSKPADFDVPGVKNYAFTLWSYNDAVRLREHIMNMFRTASCEPDIDKKRILLTFYIVGAGFTGVEMAGELAELTPFLCERFGIPKSLVKIVNVDSIDKPVPILPDKLAGKVKKRLEKMNVSLKLCTSVVGVSSDYIECKSESGVNRDYTNTVIWTAGICGSDIACDASVLGIRERGRIQTDESLRSLNYKNVYVGGDNIFYIPEGELSAVPQMVENCEASAAIIAHNLASDIKGHNKHKKYEPKFHGVMVSVGGRYAVAHVGLPGKFFGLPSFLAMLCKHFINVVYFVQVLGWNKVFSYLKHEFFTIRDCRSFLGGHFSNRSPTFFLVPVRIYLGLIWLYEGVKKVNEGWLNGAKLANFFSGANSFYDNLLNAPASAAEIVTTATEAVSSATGAADAITAATGADAVTAATAVASSVSSAGSVLINMNFLGLMKIILVKSGDFALKLQFGFVDYFINSLIIPSEGVQMAFQYVIVVSEILIGLALIAGLFTTLSSAYSLLLQAMFLTSTGLYMSSWWMIPAGVCLIFGGGRVLSLDYYVMPFLKSKWKKISFVKKWYIYND